jgi:hypothetical protein
LSRALNFKIANGKITELAPGRLEELDRIPIGILELNLSATRAGFHFITELQPRFSSLSISRATSLTCSTMRFHPPASCRRPSGIGREPDAPGPLSSSLKPPRDTVANAPLLEKVLANEAAFEAALEKWLAERGKR